MKANELRIGSLVYFNGKHQEIGVVSGITTDLITEPRVYINDRIDIPYQLSSLKPIPLTEEWFLNFGAENIGGELYDFECYKYGYIYFDGKKAKAVFQSQGISEEFEFVHQLQNFIFSSTNKELTLK